MRGLFKPSHPMLFLTKEGKATAGPFPASLAGQFLGTNIFTCLLSMFSAGSRRATVINHAAHCFFKSFITTSSPDPPPLYCHYSKVTLHFIFIHFYFDKTKNKLVENWSLLIYSVTLLSSLKFQGTWFFINRLISIILLWIILFHWNFTFKII